MFWSLNASGSARGRQWSFVCASVEGLQVSYRPDSFVRAYSFSSQATRTEQVAARAIALAVDPRRR